MRLTSRRPSGPPTADPHPSGGVGRGSSAAAERVSDDLRRGSGGFLDARRRIAALHSVAALGLGVVGLYQFGLLRTVPEIPLPGFDADRVDASGEAYQELRTPDAALGIMSAGVTLVLAGMGDRRRSEQLPLVPLALAGKVALDAAGAAYLLVEQVSKHRRICSWCTLAAVAQIAALPLALPEARAAWRSLRS